MPTTKPHSPVPTADVDAREERDRKAEHITLALDRKMQVSGSYFDAWQFEHAALPEIDAAAIDIATRFLGRDLRARRRPIKGGRAPTVKVHGVARAQADH